MQRNVWRRFRPKQPVRYHETYDWVTTQLLAFAGDRRTPVEIVRQLRRQVEETPETRLWLLLAICLTPMAARAQRELDGHHGGYKNRQARVYELIEFNDAYVEAVLGMSSVELEGFEEWFYQQMRRFCKAKHEMPLSAKQYEAISHGLSRETAVFLGAKAEGLEAHMTSRVADARGVDMIIRDPYTGKSMGIDCKTRSSYHFRLKDLNRKRVIDEEQQLRCELRGFCPLPRYKNTSTTLLRVATRDLGQIRNFRFTDTSKLGELLHHALAEHV